ncbi:MAG: glycoside hydrolase family 3 N-terminal domain-containing protein, partial [Solirubrobacteraceae bacterium]
PGQGAASQDPLDGPATVGLSRVELARRDLRPFRTALRRAPAVTVSSASYTAYDPVTPAALVPGIVRRLLRRVLRFRGVAMTDDVSALATATGESRGRAAVLALKAGIDLVYVPEPAQRSRAYDAVLRAARSGRLPRARVRDAVARVLELKRRAGVR